MEHRAVIVFHRCVIVLIKHPAFDQRPDGFLRQIWVDRAGSISQQRSEMVYLSGFSALQDQSH